MYSTIRTRAAAWVAAGAVLATAFAAVTATAVSPNEATYEPVEPCRVVDTRPSTQVGARSTPLGADDAMTVQITGDHDDCTIPDDAIAVSINLTGIAPTANTFVAAYPAHITWPGTSALNMTAGQLALPNTIDVGLSPDGQIDVLNKFGDIDIAIDIMGFYRRDGLADHETRITELEGLQAQIDSLEAALAAQAPVLKNAAATTEMKLGSEQVTVLSVDIDLPSAGYVTAGSVATINADVGTGVAACRISWDPDYQFTTDDHNTQVMWWDSQVAIESLSGTRQMYFESAGTVNIHLACRTLAGSATVGARSLHAEFTPD